MSGKNYWKIRKFSIRYCFYAFIDVADYLADQLFVKHKVRVSFGGEYCREGCEYLIVLCKVRKKEEKAFTDALKELEKKMLLTGHGDYLDFCEALKESFNESMVTAGG